MKGLIGYLRQWLQKLGEWMKPEPADNLFLKIAKTFFKCIALLIMIAFSPVIIVVLLFVFFAAI